MARLELRLDALARELAALGAAMTAQADRFSTLEKRLQESMFLVADAIERAARR